MEEKRKILYVEDENDLGNVVKQYLEMVGFDVSWETTAELAWKSYSEDPYYDLIIIDIQLPDYNGLQLAKKITTLHANQPFLFLTARNEKKDKIEGLNIGADDYITKPFDIDELVLRIRNILRRIPIKEQLDAIAQSHVATINIGDLFVDKETHRMVCPDGKIVDLTQREIQLLQFFSENQGHLLKREDILLHIWGDNDYFMGRSLDVFISRIRKILKNSSNVRIETVYGSGFIFRIIDSSMH